MDRYLGKVIQDLCTHGDLSIRVYSRIYRRCREEIMHIRIRMQKGNHPYSVAHPFVLQLQALTVLLEYNVYEEKEYDYLDFKIRLCC